MLATFWFSDNKYTTRTDDIAGVLFVNDAVEFMLKHEVHFGVRPVKRVAPERVVVTGNELVKTFECRGEHAERTKTEIVSYILTDGETS